MITRQLKINDFLKYGILAPVVIWLMLFLVIPYFNLLMYSFWKNGPFAIEHTPTFENYIRFFSLKKGSGAPLWVLFDTFRIALIVTVCAVIISYPLAYFINFGIKNAKYKKMFYMLAVIPLWISYVMKAYSWTIILGTHGLLNSFLIWLHITEKPMEVFLYNDFSVIIAMVNIYVPFVLMPLYTSLEQIPRNLIEASEDLGCNPARTFFKVVFPLSLPGVITGATYAFTLSMGDFLAPQLLGGATSSTKIANIVQMQFGTSNNWPYGAAIGVVILVLILVLLALTGKVEKHFSKLDAEEGK
jgi:spermidine/putrescine transport system permease protein